MYALQSNESWGAGNLTDWQKLCEWTAELGGNVITSLPLLASFLDRPFSEPSPYSPISRLFWNEFYADPIATPEFSKCPAAQKLVASAKFQKRARALREAPLVDYPAAMALRRQVLQLLGDAFFAEDRPSPKCLREVSAGATPASGLC